MPVLGPWARPGPGPLGPGPVLDPGPRFETAWAHSHLSSLGHEHIPFSNGFSYYCDFGPGSGWSLGSFAPQLIGLLAILWRHIVSTILCPNRLNSPNSVYKQNMWTYKIFIKYHGYVCTSHDSNCEICSSPFLAAMTVTATTEISRLVCDRHVLD